MLASLICRSGYLQVTEILRFDVLKQVHVLLTRRFGCSEQKIYRLQTRFQRNGGKNDKPPFGRPRIMTPFEVRVIVTSTGHNHFMTAWKPLKFLSHATDTRISVCTTRNRLMGARLIFES